MEPGARQQPVPAPGEPPAPALLLLLLLGDRPAVPGAAPWALLLQHLLAAAGQLGQLKAGEVDALEGHLAVLARRVARALVRLPGGHLRREEGGRGGSAGPHRPPRPAPPLRQIADLARELRLHLLHRGPELRRLPVQQPLARLLLRQLQDHPPPRSRAPAPPAAAAARWPGPGCTRHPPPPFSLRLRPRPLRGLEKARTASPGGQCGGQPCGAGAGGSTCGRSCRRGRGACADCAGCWSYVSGGGGERSGTAGEASAKRLEAQRPGGGASGVPAEPAAVPGKLRRQEGEVRAGVGGGGGAADRPPGGASAERQGREQRARPDVQSDGREGSSLSTSSQEEEAMVASFLALKRGSYWEQPEGTGEAATPRNSCQWEPKSRSS
ncbi:hypothetical protein E2320_023026 [Naja naja]|nr:hypothetical protein E2320_023026 [Naja naja]